MIFPFLKSQDNKTTIHFFPGHIAIVDNFTNKTIQVYSLNNETKQNISIVFNL